VPTNLWLVETILGAHVHRARSQLSGQAASRARCDVAMRFNMFHRPAL